METIPLKITAIGNSLGVILPKEFLTSLNLDKGDKLFASRTPGGFNIREYDEEIIEQMAVADYIMREDRDVLKKLAE